MCRVAAVAVPFLVLVAGCVSAPPEGKVIAEYRSGTAREAKDGGTVYDLKPVLGPTSVALYNVDGEPRCVLEVEVEDGARVGFQRKKGDALQAIAGETSVPLPDGKYRWHFVPGGGPNASQVAAHHARTAKQVVIDMGSAVVMFPFILLLGAGRGWG